MGTTRNYSENEVREVKDERLKALGQRYSDQTESDLGRVGAYQGQRIAAQTPEMMRYQAGLAGLGQSTSQLALQGATGFADMQEAYKAAAMDQQVRPQDLMTLQRGYMNPYQQQVIDASLDDMNRQQERSLRSADEQATRAGSYGGGRHALIEALTRAETARSAGMLGAQMRGQGWQDAMRIAQQQQGQQLSADQYNKRSRLEGLNQLGQYQSNLMNIGLQGQNALGQAAQLSQGYQQSLLDANRQQWQEQQEALARAAGLRSQNLQNYASTRDKVTRSTNSGSTTTEPGVWDVITGAIGGVGALAQGAGGLIQGFASAAGGGAPYGGRGQYSFSPPFGLPNMYNPYGF